MWYNSHAMKTRSFNEHTIISITYIKQEIIKNIDMPYPIQLMVLPYLSNVSILTPSEVQPLVVFLDIPELELFDAKIALLLFNW